MQNKLTPQQGILYTLYNNFISFHANDQEFNPNDVIAIPLQGNMTSHNLINNSNTCKDIAKQYFAIVDDIANLAKAKYGNKKNVPMLETREQAITLYDELKSQNHPICEKFNKLVEKLENNKKQTDKLYDFVKDAKTKNGSQEFKNEEEFKKFLESNKSDIAKLGATKELMQISNSFINITPEPKDFNGLIDKIGHSTPEKKNVIIELIEKILDKLFVISQAERVGKDMIRDLSGAVKQSSQKQDSKQQITR